MKSLYSNLFSLIPLNISAKLIRRWHAEAACDRSAPVLLYPDRDQCGSGLGSRPLCILFIELGRGPSVMLRPWPKGLSYSLYVIKSSQSSYCVQRCAACDALCEKYHIPRTVHPELAGRNSRIRNSPTDKIGVYIRPLDSLKHQNDHFFWVDASVFPLTVPWNNNKTLRKDPHPTLAEFNADVCNYLADNPAPFRKFSKPFLCFVGISQYYELDDNYYPTFLTDADEEMDLFAFIHHADPTKGVGDDDVNEESGDDVTVNQVEESDHVIQDERDNIFCIEDEVLASVADRAKGADHGTSDVGGSNGRKFIAALQGLLECSTLPVEVGVAKVATLPFITSSVSLIPEHEGGGHADSVTRPKLRTQHLAERFVVLSDFSHHSSTNAVDDEVISIVRSSMLPHPVLIAVVATTIIADTTSASAPRACTEPVTRSIFRDSASTCEANQDVAGPSYPTGIELSTDTFFVSQDVDSETLHKTYIPKWNVTNDSTLDDPDVFRGVIYHLAFPALFSSSAAWTMNSYSLNSMLEWHAKHALGSRLGYGWSVRLGLERSLRGNVPCRGRVVPLPGVNDQRDANVQGVDDDDVNEESGDAATADQVEESDHAIQDEWANIFRIEDEVLASVADRAKGSQKKRKASGEASGSSLPPTKLRADHGTFDVGGSTGRKFVAALQGLLERNTLPVEVGVAAIATLPFITSFVSLTPEHKGGGHADTVIGPNLCTQCLTERFVVLSDSSHHSSTNAVDDEVTSIARSSILPPPVLIVVVATTIIADTTSASAPRAC
nr:hypothetical protein [Tanacetum cinerariifolium]